MSEQKMEYTRLGNSGLKISKIVLGAMSYGSSEWQPWVLNEDKALPLIKHAYDVGINTCESLQYAANVHVLTFYEGTPQTSTLTGAVKRSLARH
jgi:hypothetical protein